jgi:hypothetical protein
VIQDAAELENGKKDDTKSIMNNFKTAMKSIKYKKLKKEDSMVCNTAECQQTGKFKKKHI